jgi:hypothetical protein
MGIHNSLVRGFSRGMTFKVFEPILSFERSFHAGAEEVAKKSPLLPIEFVEERDDLGV